MNALSYTYDFRAASPVPGGLGGSPAPLLYDNSPGDTTTGYAPSAGGTMHIIVTLASADTLTRVDWTGSVYSGTASVFLYGSNDGIMWTTAGAISGSNSGSWAGSLGAYLYFQFVYAYSSTPWTLTDLRFEVAGNALGPPTAPRLRPRPQIY